MTPLPLALFDMTWSARWRSVMPIEMESSKGYTAWPWPGWQVLLPLTLSPLSLRMGNELVIKESGLPQRHLNDTMRAIFEWPLVTLIVYMTNNFVVESFSPRAPSFFSKNGPKCWLLVSYRGWTPGSSFSHWLWCWPALWARNLRSQPISSWPPLDSVKVTDDVVGTLQLSNVMLFVLSLVRIQIDCSCYQTNLFRLNKHLIRLSIGTFVHTTQYLVILDNVLNNQLAGRERH